MSCHSLQGTGGRFGPALDTIGAGMSKEAIQTYVRNPRGVDPSAKMPAQQGPLTERELMKSPGSSPA